MARVGLARTVTRQLGEPSRLAGLVLNRANRRVNSCALELLDVQPTEHVIEIGFGGGRALAEVARGAGFAAGVDRSRAAVTSARNQFATEIEAGRVEIAEASVEALPFAERSFHCAFTVHTIYFWPQPDEGLAEVARVLRPGGRLVLVTSLKPPPKAIAKHGFGHLERSEQQIMLSRAGFTDIEFVTRGAALFATARRAP